MTVLKDQSGDPITDSAGTEIKANTTVVDALFGDGITRGTVPLDHGKGVNVDEPANLDKSLIGKTVFMNWETYGWQLGKITGVVDRSTPRLFAKYNFRVVWADRSKGPAKLAVDNYGGGSAARLNSWVLLESA